MQTKVFTKNSCVACRQTKKKLAELKIDFIEIDIDEDEVAREELLAGGWQQAPVIYSSLGSWSGYNPDKLESLANLLKLERGEF